MNSFPFFFPFHKGHPFYYFCWLFTMDTKIKQTTSLLPKLNRNVNRIDGHIYESVVLLD